MQGQYVGLYTDLVTLELFLKDDLSKSDNVFGSVVVGSNREVFWDGIPFLSSATREDFTKECGPDLRFARIDVDEVYNDIQLLFEKARKLNII